MTAETVLTGEQAEGFAHRQVFSLTAARKQVLEIEQAVLQSPEVRRLREMAEFGKVALRFDSRARWHGEHDPAASVCDEFEKAMRDVFGEIVEAEKKR